MANFSKIATQITYLALLDWVPGSIGIMVQNVLKICMIEVYRNILVVKNAKIAAKGT